MLDEIPEIADGAIASSQVRHGRGAYNRRFKEGKNVGRYCHLVPVEQRSRSAAEVAESIRQRVEAIPQIEK